MEKIREGSIIRICGVVCIVGETDYGNLYVLNENGRKMFLRDSLIDDVEIIQY